MQNRLPLHEWGALLLIISILLLLTLIATFNGNRNPLPEVSENVHFIVPQQIEVTVEGAVANPGTYFFKRGAKMQELLDRAKPIQEADLRKIKPESKLREGKHVKIPKYEMIEIVLEGAIIGEGTIQVRKGTKLSDLLLIANFKNNADTSVLEKKRKLKDGEVVHIPLKR